MEKRISSYVDVLKANLHPAQKQTTTKTILAEEKLTKQKWTEPEL